MVCFDSYQRTEQPYCGVWTSQLSLYARLSMQHFRCLSGLLQVRQIKAAYLAFRLTIVITTYHSVSILLLIMLLTNH